MSARDKITFIVGEATLTLYAAAADGSPITGTPIWMGACEDSLRLTGRWKVATTRPTGSPYTRNHPLTQLHEIALGRRWVLKYPDLADFTPDRNRYVLDVVFQDEDNGAWHRNVFYGVTIRERARDGREVDTGFEESQTFDAESMVPSHGAIGTSIPAIDGTLPFLVRWRGADGVFDLYTYDPATHQFTEVFAGITTSRATISYDGSSHLVVQFASQVDPTLTVDGNGLNAPALIDSAPGPVDVPRLDFFYGNTRVASLTTSALYVFNISDASPSAGAGLFQLYGEAVLHATLGVGGLVAQGLAVAA